MSLRAALRSVSWRRACSEIGFSSIRSVETQISSNRSNNSCNSNKNRYNCIATVGCIPTTMLSTFEEHVFQTKRQQTRCVATISNGNGCINGAINKTAAEIEAEYEEAIKTLNTLQSNAETIRRSVTAYVKQNALADMPKYLIRSGTRMEDLDKQSFIHVSGTKGKGSTCALTESILRAHGVKTGFFSSPHLVSVTERIRINGEPIGTEKFTHAFWRVYNNLYNARETETDMPPYFKFLTLLCFHIFIEVEKVDVIILEVGIGGEMDCTNVLRNTKTVGITSLGLEHTQLLGESLQEIAWQKAGIIKLGSHVYTSVTQPECLEVIKARAVEKNATLHIVPDFLEYCRDSTFSTLLTNLNDVTRLNGSLAIQLAFDWLRQHSKGFKHEFAVNETRLTKTVVNSLINCNWPGRCQKVEFMNFNIHLDGAHTVESMQVCSNWFEKAVAQSTAPKVLIFNATGDRDSKKLLDVLRQQIEFDLACFVPNIATVNGANRNDVQSATGYAEQMKRAKTHAGNWYLLSTEAAETDTSRIFDSVLDSFKYIQKFYGTDRQLDVLVTGSLHLIGSTILALNEYKKFSNGSA